MSAQRFTTLLHADANYCMTPTALPPARSCAETLPVIVEPNLVRLALFN